MTTLGYLNSLRVMESYLYKLSYDSVLLDHYLGSRNKYKFMIDIIMESPDLMDGYLPFFKYEMQTHDKEIRYKAVSMFAKLFSMDHINLAVKEPEIWNLYLERFYDRYVKVRKVCVKSSADIVAKWPDLFDDLMSNIAEIQGDSSSIIRLEVIETLNTIANGNFDLVSSNNEFWEILKTRAGDVKDAVRKKVRSTLIKLYNIHINSKIEPLAQGKADWIVRQLGFPDYN